VQALLALPFVADGVFVLPLVLTVMIGMRKAVVNTDEGGGIPFEMR
jgi:hypothetical protein